jgi:two-component system, sensor histidine kinase LadS
MNVIDVEKIGPELLEELFSSDLECSKYLANLKWSNGFTCRKCGNNNSCDGKIPYSRRCTRCKNEESASANTLFHNIKFPLSKAFFMAHQLLLGKNSMSSFDYAKKLELRHMTCWNFKHKVESKIALLSNISGAETIGFQEILIDNTGSPFIL